MGTEDTSGPEVMSGPTGDQDQSNQASRMWNSGVVTNKDLHELNTMLQEIVLEEKRNAQPDGSTGTTAVGDTKPDNMRQYGQKIGNRCGNNGAMGYNDMEQQIQNGNMGYGNNVQNSHNGNMGFGNMGQNSHNGNMGFSNLGQNSQNGNIGYDMRQNSHNGNVGNGNNGKNSHNGNMGFGNMGQNSHNGNMGFGNLGQNSQNGNIGFDKGQYSHNGNEGYGNMGQTRQNENMGYGNNGQNNHNGNIGYSNIGQNRYNGNVGYGNMGQNNHNGNMGFGGTGQQYNNAGQFGNMGQNNHNGNMGFGGTSQQYNNAGKFENMSSEMFQGQNKTTSGIHTTTHLPNPYNLNIVHSDDKDVVERMNRMFMGDMTPPINDSGPGFEPKQSQLFENHPRSADPYEEPPDDGFVFMDPVLNGMTEDEMANPCPGMKFQHLSNLVIEKPLVVVSREQWGAQPPRRTTPLKHPVQNVVISFKSLSAPCYNKEDCSDRMRRLQRYHMEEENLSDVPYNFFVGHDGTVFEGRGWDAHSSASLKHFPEFRGNRIDIAFLGDYRKVLYPVEMSNAITDLVHAGCDDGKVNFYYDMNEYREGIPDE